jgi:hypothetical protein
MSYFLGSPVESHLDEGHELPRNCIYRPIGHPQKNKQKECDNEKIISNIINSAFHGSHDAVRLSFPFLGR